MAPIRLAIAVPDPVLAEQLAAALADHPGIVLVSSGSGTADAVIGPPPPPARGRDAEMALTARELEVLALLAEGASNKLIARRLGITTHTAKFHVRSVMGKLDAVSRTDAVAHAARLRVITL